MISQKAKYAFKALMLLARTEDEPLLIAEIAHAQHIPKKLLEQILLDLKHHGIVASRRGKLGGYSLIKSPGQITFGQILRIIDGPISPLSCLSRSAYQRCIDCETEADCEIRRVFARVVDATRAVLDHTTITDAISAPSAAGNVNIAEALTRLKQVR